MRVWGLDEAAATAATLALHTAESVEDFTRIEREAKAGTAARKPPTVADLREQTEGFAKAVRQSEQGIVGSLGAILSALKTNPMVGGAMGLAGTATTAGVQVLQAGAGEAVGKMLAGSRGGAASDDDGPRPDGWRGVRPDVRSGCADQHAERRDRHAGAAAQPCDGCAEQDGDRHD
jgi:hypothetical protein